MVVSDHHKKSGNSSRNLQPIQQKNNNQNKEKVRKVLCVRVGVYVKQSRP